MSDCLFCKIVNGEIPGDRIYEDETVLAFRDIQPQAPVHVLIIPKAHISAASAITPENSAVVAHIFEVIPQIAEKLGVSDGFRVITNSGESAGQSVHHLHFHLLAGREMGPLLPD